MSVFPDSLGATHVEAERDLDELKTLSGSNPDASSNFWDLDELFESNFTPLDGILTVYPDVRSGAVLHIGSFDVNPILEDTIIAVTLRVTYSVEDQAAEPYNGSTFVRYDNGGGLVNTTIQPAPGDLNVTKTFDLFTVGVDTIAEIQALDIEFKNSSSNSDLRSYGEVNAVNFDQLFVEVTYVETAPMDIIDVTVTQAQDDMGRVSGEDVILKVEVNAVGGLSPTDLAGLKITSSSDPADVAPGGVKLYVGGGIEDIDLQLDTPIDIQNPAPVVTFSFVPQPLTHRSNFFWVTFTPAAGATPEKVQHAHIAVSGDISFANGDTTFTFLGGSANPAVGRKLRIFAANAEFTNSGLTLGTGIPVTDGKGETNQTDWTRRAPLNANGPALDDNSEDILRQGPGRVFGTDVAKEYFVEQDLSLTSPMIALNGFTVATLRFFVSSGFQLDSAIPSNGGGVRDGFIIQLSDDGGMSWNDLANDGVDDEMINPGEYPCGFDDIAGVPSCVLVDANPPPPFNMNPLSLPDPPGRRAFMREYPTPTIEGRPPDYSLVEIAIPAGSRYLNPVFRFRIRMGTDGDELPVDEEGVYIDDIAVLSCHRPREVMNLMVEKGLADLVFTWDNEANADDYVVVEDDLSSGAFNTETGTATSGVSGLTVPIPPDSKFYLVVGRNVACGIGPK